MVYPQQRSRDRRSLVVLAVMWVVLAVVAILWGVPRIEDQLADRAGTALDDAGFTSVDVRFSGRDAELSGAVGREDELTAAAQLVEGMRGVRLVRSDIALATTEPFEAPASTVPVTTPSVSLITGIAINPTLGGVLLEGTVASQVIAAAINANAAASYGRGVDDQLAVDPAVGEPVWTEDIPTLLRGIGAIGGALTIRDGVLIITGMAPDEKTRSEIVAELTALDSSLELRNEIEIDPITGNAVFVIDNRPSSVVLRGSVESADVADGLVAAGELIYGTGNVTSILTIDESVGLDYLAEPELVYQALEGRKLDLIVTAEAVYLRGVVPSDDVSGTVTRSVIDVVAPTPVVNELTVIEAAPETIAAVEAINQLIGSGVTFESGSPELTPGATNLLDQVAEILVERIELRGVVEGHTDDVGPADDNRSLSEARARAVVAYLVEAGVDPARLTSIGFGETRPIESNTAEAGRAANRRIEFKVEGSA